MARKTKAELNELCKKLNVKELYSWSRYNTYKTDTYEYFLKYVKRIPEDRKNGIYAVSGGNCHEIVEDLYEKKIKYEDMIDRYEDSLLTMNLADLKYDRNDNDKNELIANKYENCMRGFFNNHQVIEFPNKVEEFITIKISDNIYMQGYVDFIHFEKSVDENGNKLITVVITDWKTSTEYKGEKILHECGQLLIYAEGIRQLLNIPLERIKCRWNFMKYVTVMCEQANGKIKERHIERNAIGEKLLNTVKMWLKKFEYDESEIEDYASEVLLNNSLDSLPQEVKDKFKIYDCYVYIPINQTLIDELKCDIVNTVNEIHIKEVEYEKSNDENIFWQDVTDKESYRLSNLSGYSRQLHKPYDKYLKENELFTNKNSGQPTESEEDDLLDFISSL